MTRKRSYSDQSYSAVNFFVCPIEIDVADGTPADILSYTPTENITLVEAGIMITEVVASDSTDGVVTIQEGTTDLISVTVPDGTAVGATVKATPSAANSIAIDAGDTVQFNHKTAGVDAGTQTGKGYMYLKFIERYT